MSQNGEPTSFSISCISVAAWMEFQAEPLGPILFDVLQPHEPSVLDTAALLPAFGAAIARISA